MPAADKVGVDNVTGPFLAQREDMQLCSDLMGGTKAMRAAGTLYIPQEEGETKGDWQAKINRAILFNVYMRTLRYLCGRVFEKAVSLKDDADERFLAFSEDVDHMGSNLTVWSRKAFEAGLNDGVAFCVVDFNAVKTREDGGRRQYLDGDEWKDRTEAAALLNGWGPYFILVDAEQVLDCRIEWHKGRPRVTHFRYIENCQKADGQWNVATFQRVRSYFLDEEENACWQVYTNGGDASAAWILEDEGTFSIGQLPVCIFMPGEKRTQVTAVPALMDLAWLNLRHWQASCGHAKLMEYTRNPVWFGKRLGVYDEKTGKTKIIFGPGKLCNSTDEQAHLQSIGVDAGSVAASRQELQDLEDRMALFGLQLLQPKTGNITATESLRDSEENNSTLKAWALLFEDFLENCFRLAALWWKMPDGPSVTVKTDFAVELDWQLLLSLHNAGILSGETLLNLMKERGLLADDFSVEDELARLANGLMVNNTGADAFTQMLKGNL